MTKAMQRVIDELKRGATLTYAPGSFGMPRALVRGPEGSGIQRRRIQLKTFDMLRRERLIEPVPTEKRLHSWNARDYRLTAGG